MNPNSDIELDELTEELEEEDWPYGITRRKSPEKPFSVSYFGWQYGVIIGLVLLILIVVFFGKGKSVPDEKISSMMASIDKLKMSISELDGRISQLQNSVAALNRSKGSVSQRLDKLNRRANQMETRISSVSEKIRELSQAKKTPLSKVKKRYYEVHHGDTLYGIAKKHSISVEKLRRLNGMKKDQNIYPGLKLLVE